MKPSNLIETACKVLIMAEAAGVDPWETICELELEKAESEAKRSRWAGFLEAARTKTAHLAANAAQGLKTGLVGVLTPVVFWAVLTGALAGEAKASEVERLYEKPVSYNRGICRMFADIWRRLRHPWRVVRVLHRTRTILVRSVANVTTALNPAF